MIENKKNNFFGPRELLILGIALIVAGLIFAFRAEGPSLTTSAATQADVSKALASCRNPGMKEYCYAAYFRELTTATDWHHAFDVLHALQQKDLKARGCHLIAHAISQAETQKDPTKWRELMNSAPQDCSYGAAHGALEVHASTFPDGKLPVAQIPTICDNPDTHNCTHGLGHVLLVMNKNDIPISLTNCENLPHNALGKFECLTGVFMERITAINLVEHGLADESALNWRERLPELEALCRSQRGLYSVSCWKEIAHVAIVTLNTNPQKVVDFCQTAPGEEETRQCIDHAIGIMAGSMNFDFSRTKAICEAQALASDFTERCYGNLVNSTLSTLPKAQPEAERFCASLAPAYRESCAKRIRNVSRVTGD
jgi:hypothetical protein